MNENTWDAGLTDTYLDHCASLTGRVRAHVVHQALRAHLPPPPLRVVDVGGGSGQQAIPLARDGYQVTILDPSASMLEQAAARLGDEPPEVAARVELVEGRGEDATGLLDGPVLAVLCHGVLLYLDDTGPLLDVLCGLVEVGGLVSIVAKNADILAGRPALRGDWAKALVSFDMDHEINELGVDTRCDRRDVLAADLAARGVDLEAWYGVRLFTDGWVPEGRATERQDLVLAVELEASRRDPYRQMSRLFHLVGRRM